MLFCCAGHHLCEVSTAVYGPSTAAGGTELPSHCHPQSHDTGGKVGLLLSLYVTDKELHVF